MTLQQLRYVTMVAETGTITEAANRLYISQPSLTNAIHELEKEMNIVIFNRTNKGISLSREGEDFLGYARQILEQAAILEDKLWVNPDCGLKTRGWEETDASLRCIVKAAQFVPLMIYVSQLPDILKGAKEILRS